MKKWLVLYTKARHEKKVAKKLEEAGFEVFCPTVTSLRTWSDRKKRVQIPLFKSYFFIHIEEEERQTVFQYPGLVRYLFWLGKPAVVRDVEIKAIRDFINDYDGKANISIDEYYEEGRVVSITGGVFAGEEGKVIRVKKNNRILMQVQSLQLNVLAELFPDQVGTLKKEGLY